MSLRVFTVYFPLQRGDTLAVTPAMPSILYWQVTCPPAMALSFFSVTSPFLQCAIINYNNEEKDWCVSCSTCKCKTNKQTKTGRNNLFNFLWQWPRHGIHKKGWSSNQQDIINAELCWGPVEGVGCSSEMLWYAKKFLDILQTRCRNFSSEQMTFLAAERRAKQRRLLFWYTGERAAISLASQNKVFHRERLKYLRQQQLWQLILLWYYWGAQGELSSSFIIQKPFHTSFC